MDEQLGQELAMADKAKEWVLTNGLDFAINLAVFVVILIVGAIIIRIIAGAVRKVIQKSKKGSVALESFAASVTSKVLWVVLLMIALGRLGIDVAPLVAGLGVTGFIVGFAFQESLGNLAAGMMILINAPFKVGDYVEGAGQAGVVREISIMATTLSTPDNKKVVIPNAKIWGDSIINYSALDTRRVDMVAGISYAADIGKARDVISGVVKQIEEVLDDPAPMIEVVEMADSSVNLVVRPWCKTADYWTVYFKAQRGIKEGLDAAGIEIPFPQVDVHHYGLPAKAEV